MIPARGKRVAVLSAASGLSLAAFLAVTLRESFLDKSEEMLEVIGLISADSKYLVIYDVNVFTRYPPGEEPLYGEWEERWPWPAHSREMTPEVLSLVTKELLDQNSEIVGDEPKFDDGKILIFTTRWHHRRVRRLLRDLRKLLDSGKDPLSVARRPGGKDEE